MNAVAIAYKKTHCLQTRNRPKTCSNRSWLESSPFELMPKFSFSMVWGFCLDARPCFCMPIPYLFDFSPSIFFLKIFFSMLYMGERYTLPASFLKWNYLSGLKNIDKRKPLSSKARAFLGFRRF